MMYWNLFLNKQKYSRLKSSSKSTKDKGVDPNAIKRFLMKNAEKEKQKGIFFLFYLSL